MLKTILFDLDGTLLPMEEPRFLEGYFGLLTRAMAQDGFDGKELVSVLWQGVAAMVANDGTRTNEAVFRDVFARAYPDRDADAALARLETFYRTDFNRAAACCGFNPAAGETVRELKRRGFSLVLASNPVFPRFAQEARLRWAGVDPADFSLFTSYENFSFSKPNPDYYRAILSECGLAPDECLMVGNDAAEDATAAGEAGIPVFLLTDCLINRKGKDVTKWRRGSFPELMRLIDEATGN